MILSDAHVFVSSLHSSDKKTESKPTTKQSLIWFEDRIQQSEVQNKLPN